jgi:hypothetical protein
MSRHAFLSSDQTIIVWLSGEILNIFDPLGINSELRVEGMMRISPVSIF